MFQEYANEFFIAGAIALFIFNIFYWKTRTKEERKKIKEYGYHNGVHPHHSPDHGGVNPATGLLMVNGVDSDANLNGN
jgi:hypothetical protein